MSAVPKKKLTEAEYLAIERRAEFKSEFWNGEMFAMAGGSYAHNRIKDNLARHLGNQLEGGPCFPLVSDMKVRVSATGRYLYPDIVIVCGAPAFPDAESTDVLVNPAVLVEVLSQSTESYDRGAKFRQYQKIETLQEIVFVSQDEPVCEKYQRQASGAWLFTSAEGMEAVLPFDSLAVRVPLAGIYAGIEWASP